MRQIVAFILAAVLGCANLATARADRHQQAVGAQEVILPADGGPAAAGFAIFQTRSEMKPGSLSVRAAVAPTKK